LGSGEMVNATGSCG